MVRYINEVCWRNGCIKEVEGRFECDKKKGWCGIKENKLMFIVRNDSE